MQSPLNRLLRPAFLALLAPFAVMALGACGDDSNFTQEATSSNAAVGSNLYALSNSAPERLAAYSASSNTYVRPIVGEGTGIVNFDLAFDINAAGKVVIYPVRTLVPFAPAPQGGAPSIGLLKSPSDFDVIELAPTAGYVLDTAAVVSRGETYLFKLVTSGCLYGEPLYGKIIIDSIIVAEKRLQVRALTNRNCGGYRSLAVGVPTN